MTFYTSFSSVFWDRAICLLGTGNGGLLSAVPREGDRLI